MRKRLQFLIMSGGALLLVAAIACVAVVRATRPDFPPPRSFEWPMYAHDKRPQVVLGYDGPYWRVANAVRIDVRGGVAHTRTSDTPILDVPAYVASQLEPDTDQWVVVTAGPNEKYGDIVRVVDSCRKTKAHGIVLNQHPLRADE